MAGFEPIFNSNVRKGYSVPIFAADGSVSNVTAPTESAVQSDQQDEHVMAVRTVHNHITSTNMPLRTFEGKDGDDALDYLTYFDRMCTAHGWKDADKKNRFPAFLEKSALAWYEAMYLVNAPDNWDELKCEFLNAFNSARPKFINRELMSARKQVFGEPFSVYFWDKMRLIAKCDANMEEEAKVCEIIKGLHGPLAEKVYGKEIATPKDLYAKLKLLSEGAQFANRPEVKVAEHERLKEVWAAFESEKSNRTFGGAMQNESSQGSFVRNDRGRSRFNNRGNTRGAGQFRSKSPIVCYNCGLHGHMRRECRRQPRVTFSDSKNYRRPSPDTPMS